MTLSKTAADELTRTAGVFSLLLGVGEKALARGQVEDALRVFTTFTEEADARLSRGENVDLIQDGVRFALRVADATGSRQPVDWVLRVHATTARVPESEVVEALFQTTRKIRYAGTEEIDRCVAALRSVAGLTPGQKFLVNRLEGLARQLRA
ncbi:MAG: hypothetical protein IT379_42505 [Deltaproteobacteria bacterium]|nr:hypothetical protein [Deltaproteobacteria bacterium]